MLAKERFPLIKRAGAHGNAPAGWEIGTGADLGSITSGTQYSCSNIAARRLLRLIFYTCRRKAALTD